MHTPTYDYRAWRNLDVVLDWDLNFDNHMKSEIPLLNSESALFVKFVHTNKNLQKILKTTVQQSVHDLKMKHTWAVHPKHTSKSIFEWLKKKRFWSGLVKF
ncbi:hypothetical protein ILYODFUR_028295 [Ilyodon furcidens]|uniref:Uncharacterized protein n=1 Tax=Ilyodon furcidens TaxID=33524 RepID=A0ABV0VKL2_9TELE